MTDWISNLAKLDAQGPIAVLLRNGHRDTTETPDILDSVRLDAEAKERAQQMGQRVRKIFEDKGIRLSVVRTSPYVRCRETADWLLEGIGAGGVLTVDSDCLLGEPSIFVEHKEEAERTFYSLGHDEVARRLVHGRKVPGWVQDSPVKARELVVHLLECTGGRGDIGLFVSHSIVIGVAMGCLGASLAFPGALEGAISWRDEDGSVQAAYGSISVPIGGSVR